MNSRLSHSLKLFLESFGIVLFALLFSGSSSAQQPVSASRPHIKNANAVYGKLPLSFEANRDQADARVRYLARGAGYAVSLTGNGAELAFYRATTQDTDTDL